MLKARKKISKREIKEDPLVTFYIQAQQFYQTHGKKINIGILVVVALASFIIIDSRSKNQTGKRAESEIVMAEQVYFSNDYDRAITSLLPVIQKFPGTVAAGRAVFYLANCYYEKGEFTEAATYYHQYLDEYGQIDYFKASSQSGIASCLENEERFKEAAAAYEKAAAVAGDLFSKPFYLRNAARCYVQAGENEKGRSIYQKILEDYPNTSFSDEIKFLLEAQ